MTGSFRNSLIDTLSALPNALFEQLCFVLNPTPGIIPDSHAPQRERAVKLSKWAAESLSCGLNELQETLALEILLPSFSADQSNLVDQLVKIQEYDFKQLVSNSQVPSEKILYSSEIKRKAKAVLFVNWARGEVGPGIPFVIRTLNKINVNKTFPAYKDIGAGFSQDLWEFTNKLPDCVFLKIVRKSVHPHHVLNSGIDASPQGLQENRASSLFLTIRFREYEVRIPNGCFSFGLKKGVLKLQVKNCSVPIETIGMLDKKFYPNILASSDVSENSFYVVIPRGTETEPKWEFKSSGGDSFLNIQINEEPLATMITTGGKFKIKATFFIDITDIHYTRKKAVILFKGLSRPKINIMEGYLFKRILIPKLKLHLNSHECCLSYFEYEGL